MSNENKSLAEFSMRITKATIPADSKADRKMKLSMVSSDTGEDAYEERMSVELFNDFVERIEKNQPVPETFAVILEDGWNGGMPYPSISHYKSGGGKNVPGDVEKVYVDGEKLKSVASLHDSPLGIAVWKSICQDMEERDKPLEERAYENPVRVSIGFLDLEHKHVLDDGEEFVFTRSKLKDVCEKCKDGINGKTYLKGQLVHLAFTRVPANPRTSVEVMKMGDEITTKKDDAKAIIGDLAEELVGKSTVEDDVLVVKADEKEEESRDQKKKEKEEMEEEKSLAPETMEVVMEKDQVVQEPVQEVAPIKSALELANERLIAKMAELKAKGVTGDVAIKEIQPFFNGIGEVVKGELTNPVEMAVETTRAAIREEIQAILPELVAQIAKSLPAAVAAPAKNDIPAPRSMVMPERSAHTGEGQRQLTEIEKLAYKNTIPGWQG